MSKIYEIVIFTAAEQDYADNIINKFDPENKYISHRLYQQHLKSSKKENPKTQEIEVITYKVNY